MAKEDVKKAIKNRKKIRETPEYVITEPPCFTCLHLITYPYCFAFPGGIPDNIIRGKNLHTEPMEGDHGIVYEKYTDIAYERLMREMKETE
jgi:hypothetical protein